ncbi:hypothetical protein [Streptosporangium sp. KLBMP 9127]|nr:hypothetical protein [Streptosporangium sp. KLBMP 9127]
MCDLNSEESRDIVEALSEISALAGQLAAHTSAIEETAYMDHEGLAALLAGLRDRAEKAREWVADKPQQHAMHSGH